MNTMPSLSIIPDELIIVTEDGLDKDYYLKPLNNNVLLSISKEEFEQCSLGLPSQKIKRFSRNEFRKKKFIRQVRSGVEEVTAKIRQINKLSDEKITKEKPRNQKRKFVLSKNKTIALVMGVLVLGSVTAIAILKNKNNSLVIPDIPSEENIIDNEYNEQLSLRLYPMPDHVKDSISNFNAEDNHQFESKLDECKIIIDDMESDGAWLVKDYENLENIIYMINLVVADINHYESTGAFIGGIDGTIGLIAHYNLVLMPEKYFSLASLYGTRNSLEGQIVNVFEQHMYYVMDKCANGINIEKEVFNRFEGSFQEQYLFLINYIPAIINEQEVYFEQLSSITKIIALANFIELNDFLRQYELLPESTTVEVFNRKTREMECVNINTDKTLEDFYHTQYGIMLDITTGWKSEIMGRQKTLQK